MIEMTLDEINLVSGGEGFGSAFGRVNWNSVCENVVTAGYAGLGALVGTAATGGPWGGFAGGIVGAGVGNVIGQSVCPQITGSSSSSGSSSSTGYGTGWSYSQSGNSNYSPYGGGGY
jgi:hypothetical protein